LNRWIPATTEKNISVFFQTLNTENSVIMMVRRQLISSTVNVSLNLRLKLHESVSSFHYRRFEFMKSLSQRHTIPQMLDIRNTSIQFFNFHNDRKPSLNEDCTIWLFHRSYTLHSLQFFWVSIWIQCMDNRPFEKCYRYWWFCLHKCYRLGLIRSNMRHLHAYCQSWLLMKKLRYECHRKSSQVLTCLKENLHDWI
jgi:hypothetical protein